jgi:hypothetical protein
MAGLLFYGAVAACPDDGRARSGAMSTPGAGAPDHVVLRVGDADVKVTLDDAAAMRTALQEHLKQSDYEDRDAVLPWTQGAPRIDADGTLRIGPWVLGTDGKQLYLRYREPPGERVGKAHKAILKKEGDTWTVADLVMERILVRR